MKVRVAELLTSCAKPRDFPDTSLSEVAFLGRSNVGKSSLLNALVQRKQLARTSSTPGKTRLIHFFRVQAAGRELALVDLPGYGWAKVSRTERKSWGKLIESYLERREPLRQLPHAAASHRGRTRPRLRPHDLDSLHGKHQAVRQPQRLRRVPSPGPLDRMVR